jgi:ATP/maltotriose-dependent transcriptional regulator MalT
MSVLQLLADETNVAILQLLKVEPTYPRRLAAMLNKPEQKIVPKLKSMERAGLVRSHWDRIERKNVKVYETSLDKLELAVGVEGLKVEFHSLPKQLLSSPLYLPPKREKDLNFVGRGQEIRSLSSGASLTILDGIAGIGKTSLLQAFVGTLSPDAPVFWHTFKETDSFNHVVAKLAAFLDQHGFSELMDYFRGDGKDDSLKLELLVRGFDKKGYIAIFDDCQNQHDQKIESMFQHIQRNLSRARMIISSRVRPSFLLASPDVVEITLEPLSKTESARLMRNRNVDVKNDQLDLIYQRTSGLPLALTLLGAILEKNPDKLDEPLGKLPLGVLIDELLGSLNEEERNLIFTLSVFRNPIPFEGIANVTKVRGIRYLLQTLQRRMMLRQNGDNYTLHEVVREACYELVDFPEQLHRKIGEWYLTRRGTQEALEGLYHLSKAAEWARVGEVLSQYLFQEKYNFVEEGFSNSLLKILEDAKTESLPPELSYSILCVRARAQAEMREWAKATAALARARAIASRISDPKYTGYVYVTIGKNYTTRGDLRKAEANFLEAMRLLSKADSTESLTRLQLELARISFVRGNVTEAMNYVNRKKPSDRTIT